jgi:TrmH family RNA methyltransferase
LEPIPELSKIHVVISSRQNEKLKDIRRLRGSKGDRAILEGAHLVREALAAELALEYLLVTPELEATNEGHDLVARSPAPVYRVRDDVLASVTDSDSPRGVVAVASLPRRGLLELCGAGSAVLLYLDRVQDPGNLGAIARVAEAAGAGGLICREGCAHPNHPRALRGSAGSLLRLPVAFPVEPEEVARHTGLDAFRWLGLDPHAGIDLYDPSASLSPPLVLALGSEGSGLSPEVAALTTTRIRIPLAPPVESLNVATAAAVVLYEIRRRGSPTSPPDCPPPRG